MSIEPGILYVVATPIGNLEDMSPRALCTLSEVDLIAAEDTRHSRHLLQHFGISTPLLSLHEHNERQRVPRLLRALQEGKSVALISDAGTPLISDPGFQLLQSAREQGLRAVPIPGPSSLIAALSVAGLPTDRFIFEGFLPSRAGARQNRLQALRQEPRTLVFFEASHRIRESLSTMAVVFGAERQAVVARELTKRFEEIQHGTLDWLCQWIMSDENRSKGEFVVVVEGAPALPEESLGPEVRHLLTVLVDELPIKQAVAVAARISGLKKNLLYAQALAIKNR